MKDHKINENALKKCTRLHNAEKWSNFKYLALQYFYVIKVALENLINVNFCKPFFFFKKISGFQIEIKTKIRYLIICCYHNFIW